MTTQNKVGKALFIRRESQSEVQHQKHSAPPEMLYNHITSKINIEKHSFNDKMKLVIDRHNFNLDDLHSKFETIAGAFEQDRNLSNESHKLYDERILSDLDK